MWIKLALLAVALAASSADEAADPQMLRNAMEHLLQIRAPESAGSRVKRQEDPSSPHHYMMELYKKYLASDSMKTRSNTIRSLTPQRGQVDGEEMLLFNLTALSPSEVITSVELHFYKRRSMARKKYVAKPHHQHYLQGFAVDSEDSGAKPVRLVGKWEVGLDKRGWQVYDVTTAVDAASGPAIGFRFQGVRRSNGQYESLAVEQVVRMEPSPFLVVFSNERSNATLEDAGLVSQRDSNALPDEDPSRRRKRGIDDNELPEADHYASGNAIPQTSPGVLQARARPSSPGSRKISGPSAGSKSTLPYPKSSPAPSSSGAGSTLAWPDDKKRSRSGGSGSSGSANNNNRKGKRRNRKLPETWHYNQQQHINDARLDVPEDAGRALCQRRKLTVDFNEIGWGEWIISPKTFEAQYCAGRCPFPLTKELNPTNHATIQSIVHAIGGHPEVPAPCCVPDVLSSLTLLYFDDNRNVVLKNYPSMTAESCACR